MVSIESATSGSPWKIDAISIKISVWATNYAMPFWRYCLRLAQLEISMHHLSNYIFWCCIAQHDLDVTGYVRLSYIAGVDSSLYSTVLTLFAGSGWAVYINLTPIGSNILATSTAITMSKSISHLSATFSSRWKHMSKIHHSRVNFTKQTYFGRMAV